MLDTQDIIRIATRTQLCNYKLWGYGEAVAMNGLLAASRKTEVPDFAQFVYRCLDLWMVKSPEIAPKDHVAPGAALIDLYKDRDEKRLLDRAVDLAELLTSSPKSSSGVYMHDPERPHGVYVDCMYTDGPFLAKLANVTGQGEYRTTAIDYALKYIEAIQDPSDLLFYHSRDEKSQKRTRYAWGRGTGWALMGLVDILAELPAEITGRAAIQETLGKLVNKLVELQDQSGHWHTVLDYPDSYLEPSVAAIFVNSVVIVHGLAGNSDGVGWLLK